MRLLRAATHRGVAGVVVTHEAHLASWADRVVFLRDGHVVDQTVAPPGPESLLAAAIGDECRRSPVGAERAAKRRRRRPPRRDPLGPAHVPARVAAAAPGRDAPHRRRGGRDRQHHARPQHEPCGQLRVRLGQHRARVRRHRSAQARGRTRRPPRNRSERSTSSAIAPSPSPAASTRWTSARRTRTAPTAASSSRCARAATRRAARGRRHRRRRGPAAARARIDPGARRCSADCRRHRREPAQAQRRVRARLALVRGRAGPRHRFWSTRTTRRSTPSSTPWARVASASRG